ncbi:hypothetical protein F5883DRAFT_596167, partial [Diaporthe sp. PMI_573]
MAPSPITEDYYAILKVEQTTGPELITKSYKRLALKLHPDWNTKHNATKAFQLLKQERAARWRTKKTVLDALIFELQRAIRRLEQEIKNLDSILAAEAAAKAQKNSWAMWLLSPIYKKAEDKEVDAADLSDDGKIQRRYEERERQRIIKEARRHQEQARHFDFTEQSSRQTCTSTCRHDGWLNQRTPPQPGPRVRIPSPGFGYNDSC